MRIPLLTAIGVFCLGGGADLLRAQGNYNGGPAGAKTPEEERATFQVPEGFEVQLVAAESDGIGKFVPLAFDQKGRLWTTTAFEYPVDGNENPAAADALYASKAKDKVLVFDRDPASPTGLAAKPRVFAEGLAIPLGVLPYGDGCYVQHGHDIVLLHDTDGDGVADKREVILTGFGVQDSHLFPHQFMRAPGGWIWMAQGAFNYGKVARPGHPEEAQQFDQTRMAKFRPDGSNFTITSNGPCNIWGLVLNGEGEAFIQEANDFGYPVMPFHEYANYPGCSDRQWKSYAPEFPGTAPDFRMGGTGLSGLALTDASGPFPEKWRDIMMVANPITNRIQGIKMHRDGPRWKLDKPQDFLVSTDTWFRPVAITIGPDGCLYIIDWYNKIISHNEVPRNHPDRDKIRGRIWRVKPTGAKPFDVPDFTKLSNEELVGKLGGSSLAQSHLAWQRIQDGGQAEELIPQLEAIVRDSKQTPARRIQAQWAMELHNQDEEIQEAMSKDTNANVRREAVRSASVELQWAIYEVASEEGLKHLAEDTDPSVRAELIRKLGEHFPDEGGEEQLALHLLLKMAKEPLDSPVAPSTRDNKPIKVREAYDRAFERYLIRYFLEQQAARQGARPGFEVGPGAGQTVAEQVQAVLDSPRGQKLPVEARLLASLALDPKTSAARVAKLLPQLQRPPGQEEVLRLAQFPDEPGVGEALKGLLTNPPTRTATVDALLAKRSMLDAQGKLVPLLTDSARELIAAFDADSMALGTRLARSFQLVGTEEALVKFIERGLVKLPGLPLGDGSRAPLQGVGTHAGDALLALADLHGAKADLFERLVRTPTNPNVRDAALSALCASRAADAPQRVFALYPLLTTAERQRALASLVSSKAGARGVVAAVQSGVVPKTDLDGSAVDKLQAVLGRDADLAKLMQELGDLFKPVLQLDGGDEAWTQTKLSFEGPMTVETWIRFAPEIGNQDDVLSVPGALEINFFDSRMRVYAGEKLRDVVVAKKPIAPELWTHVAAVRDDAGVWRLYIDGELDATAGKPAPGTLQNVRIGWSGPPGGTKAALAEFRLWNRARAADEIRRDFDRSFSAERPPGLVFSNAGGGDWGELQKGAKITKTSDLPPILTPDEAAALDAKFAKYRALAEQTGDVKRGEQTAALCMACHLINGKGGNIGPNLSGAGAMGVEALLRNIITPNAAMENGYRIYRMEMKDGSLLDALFVSSDEKATVIRMPGAEDRRVPKAEIRNAKYLRRSLMPEGLLDALPPEQVSDLFAYLKTLK